MTHESTILTTEDQVGLDVDPNGSGGMQLDTGH